MGVRIDEADEGGDMKYIGWAIMKIAIFTVLLVLLLASASSGIDECRIIHVGTIVAFIENGQENIIARGWGLKNCGLEIGKDKFGRMIIFRRTIDELIDISREGQTQDYGGWAIVELLKYAE
jgi:hypothetical protein